MRKCLISMLLIILCVALGGCFRGEIKVNINNDGSSDVNYKFLVVPGMANALQDNMKKLEQEQFEIEKITESNMVGFKANKHLKDASELNRSSWLRGNIPEQSGVGQDRGWFYDAYKINIVNDSFGDKDKLLSPMILSQMSMKITMSFPVKPETHNANNVYNEGKTLEWNINLANESHLEANAKVWHYGNIGATVVIPMLFMAGIFLLKKKYKIENEEGNIQRLLSVNPVVIGCIVALLISGIGVAYYAINKTTVTPLQTTQQSNPQSVATTTSATQIPDTKPVPASVNTVSPSFTTHAGDKIGFHGSESGIEFIFPNEISGNTIEVSIRAFNPIGLSVRKQQCVLTRDGSNAFVGSAINDNGKKVNIRLFEDKGVIYMTLDDWKNIPSKKL